MKILAFETSCDDTAVSIIEDGVSVLAHVTHSQIESHNQYGGVVPEIAARLHDEHWYSLLQRLFSDSQLQLSDMDCIAVTVGPGLQTSLLTGTTIASFLSQLASIPLIPVHHVFGHICSPLLERSFSDFQFPVLTLTVSGGHTHMYRLDDWTRVQLLGATRDDAAGEAFDKCAKMLGLSYPGGPVVSRYAEKGNPKAFDFPTILLEKDSFDFSFSGLKASVYRLVESQSGELSESFKEDVCASFQAAVVRIFEKKVERVLDRFPEIQALHFVGGVSANKSLRDAFLSLSLRRDIQFFMPTKFLYSTDNAAMIGAAGFVLSQKYPERLQVQFTDANPRLDLLAFLA